VTLTVPVSGVDSDSTSWAPVAEIGPRWAVQPMSAFCRICETGLSALPLKLRGAPRSAACDRRQRDRDRRHHHRTALRRRQRRQFDKRRRLDRGARRQPVHHFRLIRKETAITAVPIRMVLEMHRKTHRPPGPIEPKESTGKGKNAPVEGKLVASVRPLITGHHHRVRAERVAIASRRSRSGRKRQRPRRMPEPLVAF